jgi:hypothetical protein
MCLTVFFVSLDYVVNPAWLTVVSGRDPAEIASWNPGLRPDSARASSVLLLAVGDGRARRVKLS